MFVENILKSEERSSLAMAECNQQFFDFYSVGGRKVEARFDGGRITSDSGALLLRELERSIGVIAKMAACFKDHRDPDLIEHSVYTLVAQRVYGLVLGYEDLNDHDQLRADPLLAVVANHPDPMGAQRVRERDRGKALAGKSTLNRLELALPDAGPGTRYKKIVCDPAAIEQLFVDVFVQAHATPPDEIVLDLDSTDDPLHGHQEGRFFHGYYGDYCYLPLYIFCGEHLLCAQLRTSDRDSADGALDEVRRIVARIRQSWPQVRIILRGDSGFCREELLAWCEANDVFYLVGLAKNSRLVAELAAELSAAQQLFEQTQRPARVFKDFVYQTRESWSCPRRVVGKAEHLEKGANPRFVVTNLPPEEREARSLYEQDYCARGEMENRIKEQQLYMFADRTSAASMRANQLRLWFSSAAYVLLHALRREALQGTSMEKAQCHTLRLKLLKIGALIRITTRRIWIAMAEGYPFQDLFAHAYRRLRAMPQRG
jgi:hypothetical protein